MAASHESEWNDHFKTSRCAVRSALGITGMRSPPTLAMVEGTIVRDNIECELGFGILGEIGVRVLLPARLKSTFRYRQRALAQLLASS